MRLLSSFLRESIRQGLPHIHSTPTPAGNQTPSLSTDQFKHTTHGGKIHIHDVTEKTDGQAFKFGHDHEGFYTQHSGSGSDKIRTGQGHIDRAKRRAKETGKPYVPHAHEAFAKFHDALHANKKLQSHLKALHSKSGGDVSVRGEVFNKHIARPGDHPHEVKFVHTSYSTHGMGHHGSFVIHSKLPDNQHHDVEHFKNHLSDHNVTFDHDKVEHEKGHVDVSHEVHDFHKLDHNLINTRTTPSNKQAKLAEIDKFNKIKHRVHQKVAGHVQKLGIKNKWGSGSEGLIVHPSAANPNAARFKLVHDSFKKAKQTTGDLRKLHEQVLTEGGAIKIGEHQAEAIKVTASNRKQVASDAHHALHAVADKFHADHKEHLFGLGHKHLHSGVVYSGSTHHLMHGSGVSDKEFAKHKPHVGDIDVQVSHDHKNKLEHTLKAGHKFGKYTVVGTKKHGQELSAVMKHENGQHHQFDFEGNHHPGSEDSRFKHNSSWDDAKHGIKGLHHKILLNAAGRDTHKFSPMNGLRHRHDDSDAGGGNAKKITHSLFGHTADHKHVHSFIGVTHLIKHHVPKQHHQQIYDKFKDGVKRNGADHSHALAHLRKHLDVKDDLHESADHKQEHSHVTFLGASPFTHMGHHHDVVNSMHKHAPGKKYVGLSGKSDVFDNSEREMIAKRQSNSSAHFNVEGPGHTIARAVHGMDKSKRRVLHLHFGHDRKNFADRLKTSIETGKIKELNGDKPDAVHIHYPHDENRSHGFSGTKMRHAAHTGDLETFHKHLGSSFTHDEAKKLMHRVHKGIEAGHIPLKR